MTDFYVYVHRRKDTGLPFYVGKGSGARASAPQGRNRYWKAVVAKVGFEVDYVRRDIDEEFAHLAEMELIDKLRRIGVRLTNMTDGGEGMSGYTIPDESLKRRAESQRGQKRPTVSAKLKGRTKSPEHRAKLSESRMGHKWSDEARQRMSEQRKGRVSSMLGKKHREESKLKISAAITGDKNPFYGKRHSEEIIERIKLSNLGRKHSDETRARMSVAKRGENHYMFGKAVPQERKDKQRATLMARPLVTCIHCSKAMNESNLKRWHMDNCRERK